MDNIEFDEINTTINYLNEIQENYIEGYGYERHPLPEYYAIETAIKLLEQLPCDDCISRQELLELLKSHDCKKWYDCFEHRDECMCTPHANIKNDIRYNIIDKLPPVRPKMKTAKWVIKQVENGTECVCSACDNTMVIYRTSYCPHCGAKMDVGE